MIKPYSGNSGISAILKKSQITYTEANFINETPFNIPNFFREDLQTVMREGVVDNSEFAICENIVYPVLKEVWKNYNSKFTLWSHQPLTDENKISSRPNYILARRSSLGKVVFDKPYLFLVDVKLNNFNDAWGECLSKMLTAQQLNEELKITVFGLVFSGLVCEFSSLKDKLFTKNINFYSAQEIDKLLAAINYIFHQCELQL